MCVVVKTLGVGVGVSCLLLERDKQGQEDKLAAGKPGDNVVSCKEGGVSQGTDLGLPMLPGIEPRASCVLGMCPATKLRLSSRFTFHFETGSY